MHPRRVRNAACKGPKVKLTLYRKIRKRTWNCSNLRLNDWTFNLMNLLERDDRMDKDELDRRLLVNEQSRSAENLDQLQTLAERYEWTDEEFIREGQKVSNGRRNRGRPSFAIPEKPTDVFEAYLHHLNLQDWGEEVVESIKNEVEETYQR